MPSVLHWRNSKRAVGPRSSAGVWLSGSARDADDGSQDNYNGGPFHSGSLQYRRLSGNESFVPSGRVSGYGSQVRQ